MQIFLSWSVIAINITVIAFAVGLLFLRKLYLQHLIIGLYGLSLILAWFRDFFAGMPLRFDLSVGVGIALIMIAGFNKNNPNKSNQKDTKAV